MAMLVGETILLNYPSMYTTTAGAGEAPVGVGDGMTHGFGMLAGAGEASVGAGAGAGIILGVGTVGAGDGTLAGAGMPAGAGLVTVGAGEATAGTAGTMA